MMVAEHGKYIQRGDARTTVTLDSTLYELLALKLGKAPDAKDSHTVGRVPS